MKNERQGKNFRISRDAFIALRKAIRYLASQDHDHATRKNYQGFNKADSRIGHTLARKGKWTQQDVCKAIELANRYRRQLPPEVRKAIPRTERERRFRGKRRGLNSVQKETAGLKEELKED